MVEETREVVYEVVHEFQNVSKHNIQCLGQYLFSVLYRKFVSVNTES